MPGLSRKNDGGVWKILRQLVGGVWKIVRDCCCCNISCAATPPVGETADSWRCGRCAIDASSGTLAETPQTVLAVVSLDTDLCGLTYFVDFDCSGVFGGTGQFVRGLDTGFSVPLTYQGGCVWQRVETTGFSFGATWYYDDPDGDGIPCEPEDVLGPPYSVATATITYTYAIGPAGVGGTREYVFTVEIEWDFEVTTEEGTTCVGFVSDTPIDTRPLIAPKRCCEPITFGIFKDFGTGTQAGPFGSVTVIPCP